MPRDRTDHDGRWIAFLAGAVAMLAVVLALFAWGRMRDTAEVMRADVALPSRDLPLPNLPRDVPRAPRMPLPFSR